MKKDWFEVWALGYDEDGWCTDVEELLGTFEDKQEAVHFAENYNSIDDVYTAEEKEYLEKGDYLEIRVEKVRDMGEYTENVETIYSEYVY